MGRRHPARCLSPSSSQLRAAAEEQLASSPGASGAIGEESPEQLIHELRVHQVELQLQNDELRRAQLALEDSRGKYIDLYDFAPVGYFTFTREALIAEANLTGAALLGVVRHDTGQPQVRAIRRARGPCAVGSPSRQRIRAGDEADVRAGAAAGRRLHVLRPAGQQPAGQQRRAPPGPIAAVSDITERKQAEKARFTSEAQKRMLLRTAMDGFWLLDTQGRFLEVNEAYCRMSGYSEEELLAMSISDLEAVETPAETAAHIQRIIAKGEDRFETRHRRKDGTTFDVEVSVQCKAHADRGQMVGFPARHHRAQTGGAGIGWAAERVAVYLRRHERRDLDSRPGPPRAAFQQDRGAFLPSTLRRSSSANSVAKSYTARLSRPHACPAQKTPSATCV